MPPEGRGAQFYGKPTGELTNSLFCVSSGVSVRHPVGPGRLNDFANRRIVVLAAARR